MPRVHIDISVFTPHSSFGVVGGVMEVPVVPQVGEFISFDIPAVALVPDTSPDSRPRLEVTHVLPAPGSSDKEALVMLSDLNLVTREDAQKMVDYLQDGFGLFFDEHDI